MSEYFRKPKSLGKNEKVELNLSYYATKPNLKNATGIDTSTFAKNSDLANLKFELDTSNIDQSKNVI